MTNIYWYWLIIFCRCQIFHTPNQHIPSPSPTFPSFPAALNLGKFPFCRRILQLSRKVCYTFFVLRLMLRCFWHISTQIKQKQNSNNNNNKDNVKNENSWWSSFQAKCLIHCPIIAKQQHHNNNNNNNDKCLCFLLSALLCCSALFRFPFAVFNGKIKPSVFQLARVLIFTTPTPIRLCRCCLC